jgi:hypothetical protein
MASRARGEADAMIKSTVAEGPVVSVDGWEIVVVESTMCAATLMDGRVTATAMREPVAIIVRYPDGDRVFDLAGREIEQT